MTKPKRDWPKILADLRAAGYVHYKLHLILGVARSSLEYWEQGKCEPRYSQGVKILEIYRSHFGHTESAFKEMAES